MAIFDDRRIARELVKRDGPLGRYLLAVAAKSVSNAQKLAQTKLKRRSVSDSYFVGWGHKLDTVNPGITVFNKVPHAGYIEDGTRPHIIRAKTTKTITYTTKTGKRVSYPRKSLWFIGTVNGNRTLIGVKKVNHPGTRAYNILNRAVAQALRQPRNANRLRRLP